MAIASPSFGGGWWAAEPSPVECLAGLVQRLLERCAFPGEEAIRQDSLSSKGPANADVYTKALFQDWKSRPEIGLLMQ